MDSDLTESGISVIIVHVLFLPSFLCLVYVCVQEMAEAIVPDIPPPPPQDSSTDILPDGALGEMNAFSWTVKI